MKKVFTLMIALVLVVGMTGCTSTGKNFFGIVKGVVIGDDYEAAGRMVGEAGYMAYVVMKGDPKYDKYTQKAEEIYAALDNAETFDTASMNQVILDIARAALTARYGFVKAKFITDGIRVGGVIADRLILKKVSAEDANLYVKGLKEGIDNARANTPASALDAAAAQAAAKAAKEKAKKEAEAAGKEYKEEAPAPKIIKCKKGDVCEYNFTNRSLTTQLTIAEDLRDFGFLDPNEPQPSEGHSKYKNVIDFISRCETMQKFGVKTLHLWISYVKVNADNKLEAITFSEQLDSGQIIETKCVSCTPDYELLELEGL